MIALADADATRALGERLAALLVAGDTLLLRGDLGAGKTTLVQGLAWALGLPRDRYAQSPTYALALTYPTQPPLHHLDLYRFGETPLAAGLLDDYFTPDAITCVEWPEHAPTSLPREHFTLTLRDDNDGRLAQIEATAAYAQRLKAWLASG
jgi:tRNA threonylcarbamoyladenosine biosynthesis protein TsaE